MEMIELQDFVDWEIKRLNEFSGKNNEESKPWDVVKLVEEVGELAGEVLGHSGLVRKEKSGNFSKLSLGDEVADVIIVACILARRHGVDVVDALEKKVEIIRGRRYND